MLITPFKSKAAQIFRFRGAATIANTFAVRPGVLLLLVIFLLLPPSVYAQSQTEIKDAKPTTIFGIAETAPVVVNGRVRFHVVGVTAYPAERRASEISRRIEALARDKKYDPKTLRVEDADAYHQIFPDVSGKAIFRVLQADAESEGVLRTVLADTIKNSIAESINDYRHDRKPAILAKNALYAEARSCWERFYTVRSGDSAVLTITWNIV